jgi:hypothetical protein
MSLCVAQTYPSAGNGRPAQTNYLFRHSDPPGKSSRDIDWERAWWRCARDEAYVAGTILFDVHLDEHQSPVVSERDVAESTSGLSRPSLLEPFVRPGPIEWPSRGLRRRHPEVALEALRRTIVTGAIPALRVVMREVPARARNGRGIKGNAAAAEIDSRRPDREFLKFAADMSFGSAYLIDAHGTRKESDPDTPFVGPNGFHNALSCRLASELLSKRVLVFSNEHAAAHLWRRNGFGIEFGPASDFPEILPDILAQVAERRWKPPEREWRMQPYFYVGDIGCDEAEAAGLEREYPSFHELPADKLRKLPRFAQRFGGMRLHAWTWEAGLYPSGVHEVFSPILPPEVAARPEWQGRLTRRFQPRRSRR